MARTDPRPNYGSKRRVSTNGYVYLWEPDHPLAHKDGYIAEHRKDGISPFWQRIKSVSDAAGQP